MCGFKNFILLLIVWLLGIIAVIYQEFVLCQGLRIILKILNNNSMAWVPADQNGYSANQIG